MTDITTLMNRDPLTLTKDDITLIIKDLRARRHTFMADPGGVKAKAVAAAPKKTAGQAAASKLDLGIKL